MGAGRAGGGAGGWRGRGGPGGGGAGREEGTMRYSARVRGTARLKIARYMEENADEGRDGQ